MRGWGRSLASAPDTAGKAHELLNTRVTASALTNLLAAHRAALDCHRQRTLDSVQHNLSLPDDTCVPINLDEPLCAVKPGKSTAPDADGLPYYVMYALLVVKNNPILNMFNMSFNSQCLPSSWKTATIIPILKGNINCRPIY